MKNSLISFKVCIAIGLFCFGLSAKTDSTKYLEPLNPVVISAQNALEHLRPSSRNHDLTLKRCEYKLTILPELTNEFFLVLFSVDRAKKAAYTPVSVKIEKGRPILNSDISSSVITSDHISADMDKEYKTLQDVERSVLSYSVTNSFVSPNVSYFQTEALRIIEDDLSIKEADLLFRRFLFSVTVLPSNKTSFMTMCGVSYFVRNTMKTIRDDQYTTFQADKISIIFLFDHGVVFLSKGKIEIVYIADKKLQEQSTSKNFPEKTWTVPDLETIFIFNNQE